MKKEISPAIIIAVVVVVVIAVGLFFFISGKSSGGSRAGEKPPGMPASVQQEFQKRMGGVTPNASSNGASSAFPGTKTTTGN